MNSPDGTSRDLRAGNATPTVILDHTPLEVPLNLAVWVSPELIGQWIRETIKNLNLRTPQQKAALPRPEERPQVFLALLLFACATGRFISSEICDACHSDPVLKSLCDGKPPFPAELDQFRRQNRRLLDELLSALLARAVREKFLPGKKLPPGLQNSLKKIADEELDIARHLNR